jgi:hypothetical protein
MRFGAVPLKAASAIVSTEVVAGAAFWMAVTNGRDAALVLRKARRLIMRSIMDDHRLRTNRKEGANNILLGQLMGRLSTCPVVWPMNDLHLVPRKSVSLSCSKLPSYRFFIGVRFAMNPRR